MAYEEVPPKALSIGELETIHNFSVDAGFEVTVGVLMYNYWLRRESSFPIEESEGVRLNLLMYDRDWRRLSEAGVQSLEENDPRGASVTDDTRLPAFTNLNPTRLFEARDVAKARWVEQAEETLQELRDRAKQEVVRAVGKVGLRRANELLHLLGVEVDELGEPTYEEIECMQLEGVRRVVRMMSPEYRDLVRMNPLISDPEDVEAVIGTEMEDPKLRQRYEALLRHWGERRSADEGEQ